MNPTRSLLATQIPSLSLKISLFGKPDVLPTTLDVQGMCTLLFLFLHRSPFNEGCSTLPTSFEKLASVLEKKAKRRTLEWEMVLTNRHLIGETCRKQ